MVINQKSHATNASLRYWTNPLTSKARAAYRFAQYKSYIADAKYLFVQQSDKELGQIYYAVIFQQTLVSIGLALLRVQWKHEFADETWHGHKELLITEITASVTGQLSAPDRTAVKFFLQTHDKKEVAGALAQLQRIAEQLMYEIQQKPALELQRRRAMVEYVLTGAEHFDPVFNGHTVYCLPVRKLYRQRIQEVVQHSRQRKVHHYILKKKILYTYLTGLEVDQLR